MCLHARPLSLLAVTALLQLWHDSIAMMQSLESCADPKVPWAGGDEVYQQIEVDMFRMAALYVLERQKAGLIAHLLLSLLQRTQRERGPRPPPQQSGPQRRPTLNRASTL